MNNYNLTLDCHATGYYENYSFVSYRWRRDNEIIFPNNHYIVTNSSLIVVNLTTADAGHYQCTMYNAVERNVTINTIQVIIKGMYVHNYIGN